MSEEQYIVEWLDDERASIHDEVNKVEMPVEEVVDKLNELTKTVDRLTQRVKSLNNLLTTEVVPNLIFLHGAIVYGEKKDFSSLIDKIEREVP